MIFTCAVPATMQLTDTGGGSYYPQTTQYQISQAPQDQGYGAAADSSGQGLPDDWPPTITVNGMEQVEGLVQGDNNISYSINIISQQGSDINFQVNAFCVYNPVSAYAILHIPNKPLMGVLDQDKKSLQIDFSSLSAGVQTEVIDKADVDKVLMQNSNSLVLNTVMEVESTDGSQTDFAITDMSLLQPDGVLDQFSLPGPIPAEFSPDTDRFSTLGFNELAGVLQQNYVCMQENTYVNVVNVVNEVNVINVANCGDYGVYGCYGGDDGLGGYGGCDDYGGYVPCSDLLPLADPEPVAPFSVPGDVPVYNGGRPHGHSSAFGDGTMRQGGRSNSIGDYTSGQGVYSGDAGSPGGEGYGSRGSARSVGNRQLGSGANRPGTTTAATGGKTQNTIRDTPGSSLPARANAAHSGQSGLAMTKAAGGRTASTGSPAVSRVGQSAASSSIAAKKNTANIGSRQSMPATRTVTRTNTANTMAPAATQFRQSTPATRTVTRSNAPAAKTVTAPRTSTGALTNTQPARTAAVRQASTPRTVSRAPASSAGRTASRGGGRR